MEAYKIVFLIQDLKTKDGKSLAVLSGDVHYHKNAKSKIAYNSLMNQLSDEANGEKKEKLEEELKQYKNVASFQMALDSNKEFKRMVAALVTQAVDLKEGKKKA
jgi:hypothetical protein